MWQARAKRTPIFGTSTERLTLDVEKGCEGQVFYEIDTYLTYFLWGGTWRTSPTGPGGSTAWGQITGTLSNQIDLQNALNGKANSSHGHIEADVIGLVADLAGKEPANSNIQAHIASTSNPHATTAAQVSALPTSAFVGLAKITVSGTQPGMPQAGDLWIQI